MGKSIQVHVNQSDSKPRKGTFEVRLSDGTVVVSLASMPRPFTKLRALDMEATVEQALAAYRKASAAGGGGGAAAKPKQEAEPAPAPAPPASAADAAAADKPAAKKKAKAKAKK